jgi:hypothetical protein
MSNWCGRMSSEAKGRLTKKRVEWEESAFYVVLKGITLKSIRGAGGGVA